MRPTRATLPLALIFGAAVACKSRESAPAPKTTDPVGSSAPAAAPPTPPAPTPAAPEPVSPLKGTDISFDANRVGPITATTKRNAAELKRLLPDLVVETETEEGEGETTESFVVKKGSTRLFSVFPDLAFAYVLDSSVKDPRGIGLGSTYEDMMKAYPDASCERVTSSGGEEDFGPSDSITCKIPTMPGVEMRADIPSARKKTKDLATAAKGAKLSGITVDFGSGK
jgi:hypothetical protein